MHWPSKPPCIKARHAAAASIADDPIVAHAPTNPDKDLINADFAPTGIRDRHWGALDFATFWITMVISITTWYLAASLVDMGMSWWQGVLTIFVANLLTLVPMVLNGHPGTKYGIPFPVLARSSFGIQGANLPSLSRALVACGWFGIQTWVGGSSIHSMLMSLTAGAIARPPLPLLDISSPELACFLVFWLLQVWIVMNGMEAIRLLEKYSAPLLIALSCALLVWALSSAGGLGPMLSAPSHFAAGGPKAGQFWAVFWPAVTANIGYWATLSLNIPDFTRYATSQRAQMVGQALGLPLFMALFSCLGLAVTSATVVMYGTPVVDPVQLLARMEGRLPVCLGLFGLMWATLTTNIAANVVAPANAFVNVSPRLVTFNTGALLTAGLGAAMMPWKLVSSSSSFINTWLVGYSTLIAPIIGVVMCDYFIIRGRVLDIDGLYQSGPGSTYWYKGGWNPAALVATACGAAPCLPGLLQQTGLISGLHPLWKALYDCSAFVGVEQGVPQRATCEAGGGIAKGVMGTLPPGVPNVAAILRHGGTQQGQDQGLQEWRSIQDTVTLTFKAFFDALKSQGDAIRSLEQGREDLVHALRNEMAGVLQRKANAPEVASRLAELEACVGRKADTEDMERRAIKAELEACVGRKADTEDMERRAIKAEVDATLRSHMAEVSAGLKTKMDEVEAKGWRESCERQLTALRTEVARLAAGLDEVRAALSGKASAAEVTSCLAAKVDAADLEQRLRDKASRKLVAEALACKADSSALQGVEGEVRAQLADALHALSRKADMAVLEEVSHRHDRLRSRVEADAESAAAALRALSVTFDASLSTTAKRVDDALLAESALRMEVQDVEDRLAAALARKAEGSEVASLARDSKAELAGLREAVGSRASASALAAVESQVAALSSVSSRLDALQKDVANKMSTDLRVYASLETKANVDDVNKALLAVCREVEGRASADELDALSARTSAQLQRLASLTPLAGRWLWKSGRTKAGGAVPWEIQVLAPDEDRVAAARGGAGGKVGGDGAVFTWEAGSSIIGVALPGLYELSFAFFCRKRPLVQVLVNGEPILTATGSASASSSSTTIIHHAALGISATAAGAGAAAHMLASLAAPGGGSQLAPNSQHSAGNVTGLSALEFLSLPAQARLAVTVQGQQTDGVQGFLALRKM